MKVRKDKHGVYIRSRGYGVDKNACAYRPGYFSGYSHARDTTDAGLIEGDNPKTNHVSGEPFVKITLLDGGTVYWGSYGRAGGDFPEEKSTKITR